MGATVKRVFHPWWKWECYPSGFYSTDAPYGLTPDEARDFYRIFLSDLDWFDSAMDRVMREWPNSCEQFLTNTSLNRIAWLGQSSMCIATGVPSVFRGGFRLLTIDQQNAANGAAQKRLEAWTSQR